jgi:hypothetical protein
LLLSCPPYLSIINSKINKSKTISKEIGNAEMLLFIKWF